MLFIFNRHGSESKRLKINGWHRRRRLSLARHWITTTVHVSKPCFKATCLFEQVKGKSSPEVTLTYSNKPKKTRSREREKSAILKTGEYKQQMSLLQMRTLLQWNLTQAAEYPPGEAEKMQTQEHRQFTPVCLAVQPNRGQRVWESGDRRKRCLEGMESEQSGESALHCDSVRVVNGSTLLASLSGTFLQTLPEFVTPLFTWTYIYICIYI